MTDADANEPWFDIEKRLIEDPQGQERDVLLGRLEAAEAAFRRRMDAGVSPGEFAGLEAARKGVAAGMDVVKQVWGRHHSGPRR